MENSYLPLAMVTERKQHPERFDQSEETITPAINETLKKVRKVNDHNDKLREQREAARTGTTPAQKLAADNKRKHWELKEVVKNASVREHSYGHPDVAHWTKIVNDAEASLVKAVSPGEERRLNGVLFEAREQLRDAQHRLKKYQAEHTRAVGLLKAFEAENGIAPVKSAK
jgi:hypothetical protein